MFLPGDDGGEAVTLELEKNAGGIGFSLEGGKGSISGDRPLTVNRVFTGQEITGICQSCRRLTVLSYRYKDRCHIKFDIVCATLLCTSSIIWPSEILLANKV